VSINDVRAQSSRVVLIELLVSYIANVAGPDGLVGQLHARVAPFARLLRLHLQFDQLLPSLSVLNFLDFFKYKNCEWVYEANFMSTHVHQSPDHFYSNINS